MSVGLGDCTAEAPFDVAQDRHRAQSKRFLIVLGTLRTLCLCVNTSFQETRNNPNGRGDQGDVEWGDGVMDNSSTPACQLVYASPFSWA